MNKADLEAIKERAEKATAGPWEGKIGSEEVRNGPVGFIHRIMDSGDYSYLCLAFAFGSPTADSSSSNYSNYAQGVRDNMDFIAHAREDIPALVAEIERMREMAKEAIPILQRGCEYLGLTLERLVKICKGDDSE